MEITAKYVAKRMQGMASRMSYPGQFVFQAMTGTENIKSKTPNVDKRTPYLSQNSYVHLSLHSLFCGLQIQ